MGDPTIHVVTTDVAGAAEASSNVTAPKTEVIRHDIEHTRAEMSVTIDAIQRKLDPEVLKGKAQQRIDAAKEQVIHRVEEAKARVKEEVHEHIVGARHAVHDATIGRVENMVHRTGDNVREARTTVVDTIRANPIPAAMVAGGLAWLLMSGKKTNEVRTRGYYATPRYIEDDYDVYGDYEFGAVGSGYAAPREGRFERATHRVHDVASTATHRVQDAASTAGQRARDAAMTARDVVGATAHDVRDGAVELAHRTREEAYELAERARREARHLGMRARSGAMRAERGLERTYRENPIGLGLAVLALGSLVGAALPRTRREDELLGSTRDKLMTKARDVAEETVVKVKDVADEKLNTFGQQRPSLA